jgi:hypothetical protein
MLYNWQCPKIAKIHSLVIYILLFYIFWWAFRWGMRLIDFISMLAVNACAAAADIHTQMNIKIFSSLCNNKKNFFQLALRYNDNSSISFPSSSYTCIYALYADYCFENFKFSVHCEIMMAKREKFTTTWQLALIAIILCNFSYIYFFTYRSSSSSFKVLRIQAR